LPWRGDGADRRRPGADRRRLGAGRADRAAAAVHRRAAGAAAAGGAGRPGRRQARGSGEGVVHDGGRGVQLTLPRESTVARVPPKGGGVMDPDLQDLLALWLGDHDPGEARRDALLARLRTDGTFRPDFVPAIHLLRMLRAAP